MDLDKILQFIEKIPEPKETITSSQDILRKEKQINHFSLNDESN
jgi:hypothetical protein